MNSRPALFIPIVGIFAACVGLSGPLFAIELGKRDFGSFVVGINGAMTPAGILCAAFCSPRMAQAIGLRNLALCATGIGALAFIGMYSFSGLLFWFPGRFALGVCVGCIYVALKTWTLAVANVGERGWIMGWYASALALGFSCGPFLLAGIGAAGIGAYAAGCLILAVTGVLIFLIAPRGINAREMNFVGLVFFLRLTPVLLLAVAFFGLFDHATLAFLPSYGMELGHTEADMIAALGVLNIGNVMLQVPIGWLADRYSRRAILFACAATVALGALLLPMAIAYPLFSWPFLCLWGAAAYALTTVAAAELGDRYTGPRLLAGSAAFTLAGGLGGAIGAPLVGLILTNLGLKMLPLSIAILAVVLCLLLGLFPLAKKMA
jgi:MFS family permease